MLLLHSISCGGILLARDTCSLYVCTTIYVMVWELALWLHGSPGSAGQRFEASPNHPEGLSVCSSCLPFLKTWSKIFFTGKRIFLVSARFTFFSSRLVFKPGKNWREKKKIVFVLYRAGEIGQRRFVSVSQSGRLWPVTGEGGHIYRLLPCRESGATTKEMPDIYDEGAQ